MGTAVEEKKKAKKQKLEEKQSFSNIYKVYMTLSHQNEAQKAEITAQRASEKVGIVLKGAKKRKYN